jgi:hypothetical protein
MIKVQEATAYGQLKEVKCVIWGVESTILNFG